MSFGYDTVGRIASQTDARGRTITFAYDALGRIVTQSSNGPETPIQFTYDDPNVPFSRGRLTGVTDGSGRSEFRYSQKGNAIQKTRYVDDITAIFKTDYDSLNRPITETLPDGTKLHNFYSPNGTLSSITMDTADGTSTGHTVVSYQGPYLDSNGVPSLRRTSGNGVTMEIGFEPLDKRPLRVVSKKPDGTVIGNTELSYDAKGNITRIEDKLNPARTQNFTLDNLGRVTQGTGKYGTQNYSFSANGNLIQKGAYTLGYTDGNHANAVTTATSPSTGTLNYGYDASGNMISRNGDVLRYDSYGKLIELTPYAASSSIRNTYDFAGNRVKSVSDITLISTYALGENYEIVREPGKPEKHTLYVRGLHGDLVAQWTREDATLQIASGDEVISSESSISVFGWFVGRTIVGTPTDEDGSEESRISLFVGIPTNLFCRDVVGDCGSYYKNRVKSEFLGIFGYSKYFQGGVPTSHYNVFYYLLLLGILYLSYPYFLKGNELLQRLGWKGVGTPTLILSLFVVTSLPGCGILPGTGGKQGDPPWVLALGANVTPGVPSIQNPGVGMTGGGSVGGVPVTGMFFFHPDHLGSITMITDGAGNPASGPEPGTSFVSYEPYGSIIRNDSYGPDIFRYKFTGQIEDKETGLYYYKARYYEPTLGRFLQADSVIDSDAPNGQNRYMYVEGNPVNYRDPSGHVSGAGLMHMMNRMIGHAMGKDFGSKGFDRKLSSGGVFKGINRFVHNTTFVPRGKYYWDVGNTIFSQRRIGTWWNRFMRNDSYQNSSNFAVNFVLSFYSVGKECSDNLGKDICNMIFSITTGKNQHDEVSYYNRGNMFNGNHPTKIDIGDEGILIYLWYRNRGSGGYCGGTDSGDPRDGNQNPVPEHCGTTGME
ncbi:RHS repeat-associated core domain-containing protein [Leptospira santarosai]|nr:RHS repeat-associated core domain-containing protein [Leptospira santarosai]MDO6395342.1 RHS repeat-associated core domain-containing protein [Leptospira santarosai]